MPSKTSDNVEPVLVFNSVSVQRGETLVLNDINWTIRRGENWAVLGPNGSGKSTLAAAIAGDVAHSGDIDYAFATDVADPCQRIASVSFRLHRAFVAQSDGYYQSRWYIGEEDATLTAGRVLRNLAGRSAAARRQVANVVKKMGIARMLDRQTLHLSTGEMRRFLISRALVLNPEILVLDEPFVGLDVAGRARLSETLSRLMKHGQQIILLTARPWELPREITHTLWIQDGQIVGDAAVNPKTGTRLNGETGGTQKNKLSAARKLQQETFGRTTGVTTQRVRRMKEASADAESVIELKNVSIKAGDARILKELDWTVRRGERWAVAGKNGAGKTTLLSLLIGDHPQVFAQHIRLFGHQRGDGQTLWEYKAQIGWAAPDIALHYDTMTTTFQFVCTGFFETLGLYRDCSRAQQRTAREWLEYFGLSGAADVPFRLLSDGQQRLVLLARALVKNPPLLILDEPCQGLDAASRARVLAALERVCKAQGTTLIIVTHYRDELPACITHSLELKKGQRATVRKVRATR